MRRYHWYALGSITLSLAACVLAAADDKPKGGHPPTGFPEVPPPDAKAAQVPDGFKAEVVLSGLTYPTSVELDDHGSLYVAEAGYSYGDPHGKPRVLRVSPGGKVEPFAGEGLERPVNDLLWHRGRLYASHRGKISRLTPEGKVEDLVTGLPSFGDHHNNQLTAGPDGKLYFGQGTATNSGVVGEDNFKMGWLAKHPDFHDVPAKDVKLIGRAFPTLNVFSPKGKMKAEQVKTSAFHPFGKTAEAGEMVKGETKASGTILRVNPDGTGLKVYAWGFRNPFGVLWGPDGKLYVTENGFDVRGSRPVANDKEDLYEVKEGAWYGWPDYASGVPVTDERFKPEHGPGPSFLLRDHPPVEKPLVTFPKHAAIAKLDASPGGPFGQKGQLFVAFFGHMTPMTGKPPEEHGGHRVARVDRAGKKAETFFGKKHGHQGEGHGKKGKESSGKGAKGHGHSESASAGPRRLVDVRFTAKGEALYVVDFGAMFVTAEKVVPVRGTGVLWRVVPEGASGVKPAAGLSAPASGGTGH
jgi:glucose/arabinose dehydrogenase